MNWARNNRFLAGFLAVVVVVGGVLAYLLFSAQSRYSEVSGQYDTQVAEMKRLQEQKMFPNDANVRKYEEVRKDYQQQVNKLQTTLASYEPAPEKTPLTPLQFQDILRQKVEAVVNKAQIAQVALPEGFYLGFEKYKGAPPETEATPLLTTHLAEIENLVNLLIAQHIEKITSLKRTLLSQESGGSATAAAASSATRPTNKPGAASAEPLVSKYPFEIAFTAAPSAFRESLNKITSDKIIYIIRALQVKNQVDKGPSRTENSNLPGGSSNLPPGAPTGAVDATGAPVPPLPTNAQPALRYVVGQERLDIVARIELASIKPPASTTR